MKRAAWIVIAVGGAARLAWAIAGPDVAILDAAGYRTLARSLVGGHGYALQAGPSAYWVPGWPAWMAVVYALFGAHDGAVTVSSVFLGGATIAATWALARELADEGHRRAVASIAAVLCALLPSLVLLPRLLLSENLAVPLFTLALVALARASRTGRLVHWLLFGLIAAVATYVRESCAVLALGGVLLARGPRLGRALIAIALVGALLVPWVERNREVMGVTTLTTSAGVNLCIGLGPGATGGHRAVLEPILSPEAERHTLGTQCAKEGLREHPLELLTLAPAKLSRLFVWDDWIVDDFLASTTLPAWFTGGLRVLCDVAYWLLWLATLISWRRGGAVRFGATVIGLVSLPVLATFGVGRFHALMLPLLCVTASRGIVDACNPERPPKASQ